MSYYLDYDPRAIPCIDPTTTEQEMIEMNYRTTREKETARDAKREKMTRREQAKEDAKSPATKRAERKAEAKLDAKWERRHETRKRGWL